MFQKTKNFILDTLFPISCTNCGCPDTWLCPDCLQKITILSEQVCPYCEKITTPAGKICRRCREKYLLKNISAALSALICSTKYSSNNISKLIHLYKYNFIKDLHIPLGKIMTKAIARNNLSLPDIIIPVPLHRRRLRWRGFNQAELLADYVSRNLAPGLTIPVGKNIIIRKHYTRPQMRIKNYRQRKKNIFNSFINSKAGINVIKERNVLLVDDVCTTGATLFECAKILKKSGTKSVSGIVIARQEIV